MSDEASGFRGLATWQQSYKLARDVYRCTQEFPHSEQYGLTSQIQRAALSIPSNVAEGYGRGQDTRDCLRFLLMARGSLYELETCLLLSKDLGYLPDEAFASIDEIRRRVGELIGGMIRSTAGRIDEREKTVHR